MTPADRLEALRVFGYTAREAAFLATAMLHGGYFIKRQLTAFLGRSTSQAAQLLTKLVAQQHATVVTSHHGTRLYHVCAKRLYAALNEPDIGKRRRRPPIAIKTRLMALDYVLGHPDEEFLATEAERVDYFAGVLGIDRTLLPQRRYDNHRSRGITTRYFADHSVIGLVSDLDSARSRPSFVYLDEAGSSLSGFRTYLDQYRRLFGGLTVCQIVYASDSERLFGRAAAVFERFSDQDGAARTREAARRTAAVLEYFRVRRRYETRQFAGFTKATLDRFRDDRERFQGAHIEAAYEQWMEGGDDCVRNAFETDECSLDRVDARFETYWLNHTYALCGTRSEP